MSLAIFDLDNTLLAGDSDHSWGQFMVEKGIVDSENFNQQNDAFYRSYQAGTLDMDAYVAFALSPVIGMSKASRDALRDEFMQAKIEPLLLPKALELIAKHRSNGDTLMIITATNYFITEPIAKRLGIDLLLATNPETINDKFTGRIVGTPCFQDGKVTRLQQWLDDNNENLQDSFFYSDSFNDLPLLKRVSYPYAVDPDETLTTYARENNWPIISLR